MCLRALVVTRAISLKFLWVLLIIFPFYSNSDQAEQKDHKLLILGDSLSAAYGLTQQEGWVYLLQEVWNEENKPITLINAAISGDTTDGGLARLPRLLSLHEPSHLLIELGGNDALQGHNPKKIKRNIQAMVDLAKAADVEIMIQEMQIPSNYGRRYTQMFTALYNELARENNVPMIPFFLADIAIDKSLMQNDGIHPTAEAQVKIVDFMKPKIEALMYEIK